jgi:hypothetical protein
MSETFGPGAGRLGGLAARLLGWRPHEFWSATPAELAAVLAPYASAGQTLARDDLNRLMERDNAQHRG